MYHNFNLTGYVSEVSDIYSKVKKTAFKFFFLKPEGFSFQALDAATIKVESFTPTERGQKNSRSGHSEWIHARVLIDNSWIDRLNKVERQHHVMLHDLFGPSRHRQRALALKSHAEEFGFHMRASQAHERLRRLCFCSSSLMSVYINYKN